MYRSCQMVVAKASVSQKSTGEPSRAASSSSSAWRWAMTGKSEERKATSGQVAPGSSALSSASLSSLYSRPYSGTYRVRAQTPPRRR